MDENMDFIGKNGEITNKTKLIEEIQDLLNANKNLSDTKITPTYLNHNIMHSLQARDLEDLRDFLVRKRGFIDEEWLASLL